MYRIFALFFTFIVTAQQLKSVDFIRLNANLIPNFENKSISGNVNFEFIINQNIDTIKIDAKNMNFNEVYVNGKLSKFKSTTTQIHFFENYKLGKNSIQFKYDAKPKQAIYFVDIENNKQIWTQGQGKNNSNWLPSFDDVNEKLIFNLSITYNADYEVISNGNLINSTIKENQKTWHFAMQKPMSSYLVMLAISKYKKRIEKSKSGTELVQFLNENDSDKFETTYKNSSEIFDFLEKKIGFKYPWKIYKQAPVSDFLYAGMENTSATLFSQMYVTDSISKNDTPYFNVNAHELAHQWFGNLVTAKTTHHHWLQEGFATYYALLAEKQVFGIDYFYNELYNYLIEIEEDNKINNESLTSGKASSTNLYKKGAWALFYLNEKIGDKLFDKTVKNYLKKHQFKNVETTDFLNEIALISNFNIHKFNQDWLNNKEILKNEAMELLLKNKSILQIDNLKNKSKLKNQEFHLHCNQLMKSKAFYPVKQEVLKQNFEVSVENKIEILKEALRSNSVEITKTLAKTTFFIPDNLKEDYINLLKDNSFITKELALIQLCKQYNFESAKFLEITKNVSGGFDKSFRITWILLAFSTPNYQDSEKQKWYWELLNYTSPKFDAAVRKNAFEAFLQINKADAEMLTNLVQLGNNHRWQYSKWARETIKELVKNIDLKIQFEKILPELSEKENNLLKNLLK